MTLQERDAFFGRRLRIERALALNNQYLEPKKRRCFKYGAASESVVPACVRDAAREILVYCRERFNLPKLNLRWIAAVEGEDRHYSLKRDAPIIAILDDWAGTSPVFSIRHDVPLLHIQEAIAHEAHHIWFREHYGIRYPYSGNENMWEDAAEQFAVTALWETGVFSHPNPDQIALI